jgi:glyoxylate reductase
VTGPFDSTLISVLPKSLKYIVHNGAGYDNIDIPTCTEHGILVSNTPSAVNDATADTALFLLLGAIRQYQHPLVSIRQGKWRGPNFKVSHDPEKKVLGILGLGGIGTAVAKRAEGFSMKIQYNKRHPDPNSPYKYVSFDELLATSDVLSLNLSLTEQTKHIINREAFSKMKDGIILINTARGGLVDEEALVEALKSGKVRGAGLDVYEHEPEVHPELLKMENVILLPHVGTATIETQVSASKTMTTFCARLTTENL